MHRTAPAKPDSLHRADNLARLLPNSWKDYPPSGPNTNINIAHYDASRLESCTFKDFLLSVCYQLLVLTHHDASIWQQTMNEVESKVRSRVLRGLTTKLRTIEYNFLFDLMTLVVNHAQKKFRPGQPVQTLCVLKNLHWPSHPEFAEDLLKLKDGLRRTGVHVLGTGSGWKPDTLPATDEEAEYLGMCC